MTQEPKISRYPGPKSFISAQEHLFMGRNREKKELCQLINARSIVVLYGKSGYGKSSLMNAGVIPILERDENLNCFINIRFQASLDTPKISPVELVLSRLKEILNNHLLEGIAFFEDQTIKNERGYFWYWLKQVQSLKVDGKIILFFDQFEELFFYDEKEIERFAQEINIALYQIIPDFLRQKDNFQKLSEEDTNIIYSQPDLKLVFAIRSDRLSLLNRIKKYIPDILGNHYELDALSKEGARDAIIKPALINGENLYKTSRFNYKDDVVDTIIEKVKNRYTQKIESAPLQIICQFIESKRISQLNDENAINIENLGDTKEIFTHYYDFVIESLDASDEEKELVKNVIETEFIKNDRRVPFAEDYLLTHYQLSQSILTQLEKESLLRIELDSLGRTIYELGHDTLIEPIKARTEKRYLETEIKKQEEKNKKLEEQHKYERIAQELQSRKKLFKYMLIAGATLLGLLVCTILLWKKAGAEKENAEKEKGIAQQALNQVFYQQAKTVKENGDNIKRNGNTYIASDFYDSSYYLLEKIQKPDSLAINLRKDLQKLRTQ